MIFGQICNKFPPFVHSCLEAVPFSDFVDPAGFEVRTPAVGRSLTPLGRVTPSRYRTIAFASPKKPQKKIEREQIIGETPGVHFFALWRQQPSHDVRHKRESQTVLLDPDIEVFIRAQRPAGRVGMV